MTSPKTPDDREGASYLTDPNYGPDSDNKKSLQGLDFTEPGLADIQKKGKVFLGSYLTDYVTIGRQGNNQNNELIETQPFTDQNDNKHLETTNFFEPADLTSLLGTVGKKPKDFGKHTPTPHSKPDKDTNTSGNDLLRNIVANPGEIKGPSVRTIYTKPKPGSYQEFVLKRLVAANLYHPTSDESPFVIDPTGNDEQAATKGLFTIQRDLGSFVVSGTTENDPASGLRVTVNDMSRMALSLLAQGTGEAKESEQILGGQSLGMFAAVLHTTEQLGILGVPISKLRIKGLSTTNAEMKKKIDAARGSDDFLAPKNNKSLNSRGIAPDGDGYQSTPYNSVSYAQFNTFLEPFGSLGGSGGMLVIAIEGVLALIVISLLISGIDAIANVGFLGGGGGFSPKAAGRGDGNFISPLKPYDYDLGVHGGKGALEGLKGVLIKLLRITDTDYDFENCVANGILLLVGFNPDVGKLAGWAALAAGGAALAEFALNLVLSPSYYANLFRQIVRDANETIARFREIGGSLTSGIGTVAAAIEKLVSSKAYQFIMIAAGVGDASLKSTHGQLDVGDESRLHDLNGSLNPLDSFFESQGGDAPSGWDIHADARHGRIRSRISRWEGGENPLSLHTFLASYKRQPETNPSVIRSLIKPTRRDVEKIERDLEAEYMPFYFHDLRTHEVISLPAFVTQFNESFNVNYTSNTGYGRQDPVRTYESAERTMSFAFRLVAFGKEDFDEMWLLVNKLVAMCYPQYSKGRQREYKQVAAAGETAYQFIQPFSQIPAASPVIRLRFGDILKSNYSKQNLERQFKLNEETNKARKEYQDALNQEVRKLKDDFEKNKSKLAAICGVLRHPEHSYSIVGTGLLGNNSPSIVTWPADAVVEIVTYNGVLPGSATATVSSDKGTSNAHIGLVAADISFDENIARSVSATKLAQQAADLKAQEEAGSILSSEQNANFFKVENNAIVRSFESTKGKGMAGVITSLAFDYGDYPYEITPGSRAPKMIDVSLGFSPMHDLPLGLDYDGNMRAPSHPVGNALKGFGSVYEEVKKK